MPQKHKKKCPIKAKKRKNAKNAIFIKINALVISARGTPGWENKVSHRFHDGPFRYTSFAFEFGFNILKISIVL